MVSSERFTNRVMHCGELARVAGVSADTIRYYERKGLLQVAPRSASGYRLFPQDAAARVQLIRSALGIGFTVRELAQVLRERNGGGAPCHRVRKLVAGKLAMLEARLRELRAWRADLRSTLAQWDRCLAETPRGKQARLLEAYAATHPQSHVRNSKFRSLAHGNSKREKQR
ncbi:MAG: MerR family transcriptional regulator [Candidatus Acidiferrales bacterium]